MTDRHTHRVIPLQDLRPDTLRLPTDALDASLRIQANGLLADTRGRALRDLRISVTDRCNFRCNYCMPKEIFDKDYAYLKHADLLSFEEITRMARGLRGPWRAKNPLDRRRAAAAQKPRTAHRATRRPAHARGHSRWT